MWVVAGVCRRMGAPYSLSVKCPIGLLGWHVGIGPTAGPVVEESTRVARECTVNAMVPGEEVAKALTSRALIGGGGV